MEEMSLKNKEDYVLIDDCVNKDLKFQEANNKEMEKNEGNPEALKSIPMPLLPFPER